jgi:acetylornithine deacetylase/succinyl-diaminopimelate desuccinylase-like protein
MPTSPRQAAILDHTREHWRAEVLPLLESFARIPDLSPAFEPEWEKAGHLDEAAELLAGWASRRPIPGAVVEIVRIEGLTPTVVIDVPATDGGASGTVLIYGHYDKQPPFEGWAPGRGAWSPVIEGDLLYARGVADDGYALPTALLAIEAVEAAGGGHGRCLVLAEGSEESGSPHLPAVLDHLADRIGIPELVIALDSGSPTYDRLWITTSLRGTVTGTLSVSVLTEGVHSGSAGAVVPSSFRIMRLLLDRIEDAATGDLLLPELVVEPPPGAFSAAVAMAGALIDSGLDAPPFPVVEGLELQGSDVAEREMRTAWLGSVAVVGADGLPPSTEAGNVLRPSTSLRLTIRIPPTCDPDDAAAAVERALTSDPPYGALVEWTGEAAGGWAASPLAPWLAEAIDDASVACFDQPSGRFGEGGTIPFMGWLASQFPEAQLLAAGVLGPGSNAHGPNESLHLPTAERISAALGMVFDAHGAHLEAGPA